MNIKAALNEEKSSAIVVSFDATWEPLLNTDAVHHVFRKRGPANLDVKWIYVYMGSPIKALVGRLPVSSVQKLSIKDALNLALDGAIEYSELKKYAIGYLSLYVFDVGKYEKCKKHISYVELNNKYNFHPPQSFLYVSKNGHDELNTICGFLN